MGYYTIVKAEARTLEWFDRYWKAKHAIEQVYDMPKGSVFRMEEYGIVDEYGNPAEQPEEEKKPFCISKVCGEIPLEFFEADKVMFGEVEEYDRVEWLDSIEDAKKALEKYESIKMNHKGAFGDLVTFCEYFIEEVNAKETVRDMAAYAAKEKDWRGGKYNEYDCYTRF